jgi:hypothetical protein
LRDHRKQTLSSFSDHLQLVLSELTNRTVRTNDYQRGRIRGQTPVHIDTRGLYNPIARMSYNDHVLIVTGPGLKEICLQYAISVRDFTDHLQRSGILRPLSWVGVNSDKIYPFRGTDLPNAGVQVRCYIFDLSAMEQLLPEDAAKIVGDAPPETT